MDSNKNTKINNKLSIANFIKNSNLAKVKKASNNAEKDVKARPLFTPKIRPNNSKIWAPPLKKGQDDNLSNNDSIDDDCVTKPPENMEFDNSSEWKNMNVKDSSLDSSLPDLLSKISEHLVFTCAKEPNYKSTKEEEDKCKIMYINLLENISNAFLKIPNHIKEQYLGYDSETCSQIGEVKAKLKLVLGRKRNDKKSIQKDRLSVKHKSESKNMNDIKSTNKVERKTITSPNGMLNYSVSDDKESLPTTSKQTMQVSTLVIPSETTNEESVSEKLSKRTIDKLHNISEKLKPLPSNDLVTKSPNASSSVPFQPPKSSIAYLQNLKNSICTDVDGNNANKDDAIIKNGHIFSQQLCNTVMSSNVSDSPSITRNINITQATVDGHYSRQPSKQVLKDNSDDLDRSLIGKFCFKRPSSLSEDVKRLSASVSNPSCPPISNTSSSFECHELNKSSSPVNENTIIDLDKSDDQDYDIQDIDETYFQAPLHSSGSTNNINTVNINLNGSEKDIVVDNDGWPVYNAKDFEDNVEVSSDGDVDVTVDNDLNMSNKIEQTQNNDGAGMQVGMGDFVAGTRNDGVTGEFDGFTYGHSELLMDRFSEKFGLKAFRPNQLQAINATLLGHDCFVLMPTGGGKSLCYQLPAIMTPGVTIVVSPLKSLILDQVNKLLSLDIQAAHLSGDLSLADSNDIYDKLTREPALKLLYVTPEKLRGSNKLQNMLDSLYNAHKLDRFVIDEAHCVSQWGHDFRPDYKRLSMLRERFPNVPIMTLTATATPRVRLDILHQLKVKDCKWFLCSFNRPNLSYQVLDKKPKSVNQDVIKLIRERFSGQSGIVYCLSRNDCDEASKALRHAGVRAAAYHAGLADRQREELQTGWLADKYHVICATIAFGMGVDKADVRFVIHHSMPSSLEGYYQETGRAGRDGLPAACLLYYSGRDVMRHRHLIQKDRNSTEAARQVRLENLQRMEELCESVSECRRKHILAYLGERFSREMCAKDKATACDNCLKQQHYKPVDVTEQCQAIARSVRGCGRAAYTLLQMADALRGSQRQRLGALRDSPLHALCRSWPAGEARRLLRHMVVQRVLSERIVMHNDIPTAYLAPGPAADDLLLGKLRVVFPMRCENKSSVAEVAAPAAEDDSLSARVKRIEDRCYADLVEACREMGAARGASLAAVLPQAALRAMAARLPETAADMLAMPHITRANYDKYGAKLLTITAAYALEKLGVLMEYQDEQEMNTAVDSYDQSTEWPAAETSSSRGSRGYRGRQKSRSRKTYRGGVRKRTTRKAPSSAKKKAVRSSLARGASKSGSTGSSWMGVMPPPVPRLAALNQQQLKAKSLKF